MYHPCTRDRLNKEKSSFSLFLIFCRIPCKRYFLLSKRSTLPASVRVQRYNKKWNPLPQIFKTTDKGP
ncbi:hypothetical protein GCWU000342_00447 [Shuttleworthella satelles DSM 14600]|uniref:Uncharacterized protein n=1 Tax=Shuttleworthella satelles DSM 14600 TaxID=626523 RepID=C4G8Z7_9FIRM|nr:hypothetical protein GCWU000342_00447 [Shuttleworthia satelles DSM 14600]